jgi:2,4-dienoyl-CoA reductase-like NADH-dependent reductase (Old Yellow Enzyme family)
MKDYLNEPLELPCGVVIANRLAKAAMTEGLADAYNQPTEAHVRLYRRWAEGGVGLSLTGNVMVDREHLERPGNVAISSREVHPDMTRWAAAGASGGGQLWMQLGHAGRQTPKYINPSPKSSSVTRVRLAGQFGATTAYGSDELRNLVGKFADAAWVAKRAGFGGVQIHAAHGFLISEFLSPVLNQRKDHWGGSLKNRARLLLEITEAVRDTVGPDFPVSIKLNSEDFQQGGFSIEECLSVVQWIRQRKVDLLEVTGGSYETPRMVGHAFLAGQHEQNRPVSKRTQQREAYFIKYAKIIREAAAMPIMVTGGFRSRSFMLETLRKGELDMIGMARPLIMDPDLPRKLLSNQCDIGPCIEKSLRIKSDLFGPGSPFFAWRLFNIQGQQGWLYHQLRRMGNGLDADMELGLLRGFLTNHVCERLAACKLVRSERQAVDFAGVPI